LPRLDEELVGVQRVADGIDVLLLVQFAPGLLDELGRPGNGATVPLQHFELRLGDPDLVEGPIVRKDGGVREITGEAALPRPEPPDEEEPQGRGDRDGEDAYRDDEPGA
jgi:hypothetical protein